MGITLLEACQAAAEEVIFSSPSSIVGNSTDTDAVLLGRLATNVSKELIKSYNWQALKREYTWTSQNGVVSYSLPSDFSSPIDLTSWDRTTHRPLLIANHYTWQSLMSGITIPGYNTWLELKNNQFNLIPTPSNNTTTFVINYYSKNFCLSPTNVEQSSWVTDNDTFILDDELLTRGIKWKFAHRKGLPYGEYKQGYLDLLNDLQADDIPRGMIDVSGVPDLRRMLSNLPETGFGTN